CNPEACDFGLRCAKRHRAHCYNCMEMRKLYRKQEHPAATSFGFLAKSIHFNGFHRSTLRVCYIFSIWRTFLRIYGSFDRYEGCVGNSELGASAHGRKSEKTVPW